MMSLFALFVSLLCLIYAKALARRPHVYVCLTGLFCAWSALIFGVQTQAVLGAVRGLGALLLASVFLATASYLITDVSTRLARSIIRPHRVPLPPYIGELCKAFVRMSALNIGALVIIERAQRLTDHVRGGIILDAEVKAEVLIALFSHPSPVHDGAIIIRNGRIHSVKVILPLATASSVPMGVGTRHRSAIGITEKADALALVVSEERGEISLAAHGKLFKVGTPEALPEMLTEMLFHRRRHPAGAVFFGARRTAKIK